MVWCEEKRELPNNGEFHSNQSNGVVVHRLRVGFVQSSEATCEKGEQSRGSKSHCWRRQHLQLCKIRKKIWVIKLGIPTSIVATNSIVVHWYIVKKCKVVNGIKHLPSTLFSFFLFTIEFLATVKLTYDAAQFLHLLISSLCSIAPIGLQNVFSLELTSTLLAKDNHNVFGLMQLVSVDDGQRSIRAYGIYSYASFFLTTIVFLMPADLIMWIVIYRMAVIILTLLLG
ncbi:hypothetical protein HN51_061643 [Arachis hypogaea]|uniref:uncharacterized protein LOC107616555 isoform X1 n=1 Tax=Arachis ipaensis TaxID=130454 RepID=UPI000A2AF4D0|nr:uncharacterized protein LOC107616555 isoform X1 [Arachis ipaensis]XP_025626918.1 uncharacterized protein LOC112720257 isoform X1 [Arachis hypogaea]